ncbi:MAG: hypothetical protein L3J08_02310 [Flavobacteriaceae bacterium]|nr:hypothetical protein [Flavobacteriaceae bacterium]
MKKIALIAVIIIVSSAMFSCGGTTSCVSSEKYIPAHLDQTNDLDIVVDLSDLDKLNA